MDLILATKSLRYLPRVIFQEVAETGADRQRYIKAMKAADHNNHSKLEKLIANALKESLENI